MADNEVTGWVGWGWFAGIVLLIAGVFSGLHGLTAILAPSSAYFLRVEGGLVVFDVQGWGWWHLITGIALILVAGALFSGATWARVVAVILVAINAVGQLFTIADRAVVVAHRADPRRPRDLRAHGARPRAEDQRALSRRARRGIRSTSGCRASPLSGAERRDSA